MHPMLKADFLLAERESLLPIRKKKVMPPETIDSVETGARTLVTQLSLVDAMFGR